MMRIGNGFDAHRFKKDSSLILGGVSIPHHSGMEAHSDGDVVLHAVCDAILGALAKGDIGQHFPDTSSDFSGIDSRILLRKVAELMKIDGYVINNLDVTIVAQAPKLASHIPQMRQNIAEDLETSVKNVSVKATTTEKMGYCGREEGIAVMSSVLLVDV